MEAHTGEPIDVRMMANVVIGSKYRSTYSGNARENEAAEAALAALPEQSLRIDGDVGLTLDEEPAPLSAVRAAGALMRGLKGLRLKHKHPEERVDRDAFFGFRDRFCHRLGEAIDTRKHDVAFNPDGTVTLAGEVVEFIDAGLTRDQELILNSTAGAALQNLEDDVSDRGSMRLQVAHLTHLLMQAVQERFFDQCSVSRDLDFEARAAAKRSLYEGWFRDPGNTGTPILALSAEDLQAASLDAESAAMRIYDVFDSIDLRDFMPKVAGRDEGMAQGVTSGRTRVITPDRMSRLRCRILDDGGMEMYLELDQSMQRQPYMRVDRVCGLIGGGLLLNAPDRRARHYQKRK